MYRGMGSQQPTLRLANYYEMTIILLPCPLLSSPVLSSPLPFCPLLSSLLCATNHHHHSQSHLACPLPAPAPSYLTAPHCSRLHLLPHASPHTSRRSDFGYAGCLHYTPYTHCTPYTNYAQPRVGTHQQPSSVATRP